jgi:hypothetical protein
MDVPGFGRYDVIRVFQPDEPLPSRDDDSGRYLVTADGAAHLVAQDAEPLE